MKISVIIPAYNELKYLPGCLRSLENQSFTDFEVIVIDDGSDDGTSKYLKSSKFSYPLHILNCLHRGAGAARNLGAQKAKGEILVFIDADMEVDSHYLEMIIKPIKGKVIGSFTKEEYVGNYSNFWSKCWNWEYLKEKSDCRLPKHHPSTSPVFRAIKKSEFDKVGGYAEVGYGEDHSLSQKLGELAHIAPGAIVYHYNPASANEVFRQAVWLATRPYKLGYFGRLIALARASLPVSLILAFIGTIRYRSYFYFIFKLTYDSGIFFGQLIYLLTGKLAQ